MNAAENVDFLRKLHDLKPLAPFAPTPLLHWVVIIVTITALALWLIRQAIKKKRSTPTQLSSLLERALTRTSELEAAYRAERLIVRDYASALSLCLRNLLEEYFSFPSAEMTTRENRSILEVQLPKFLTSVSANQRHELMEQILKFLETCDQLVFGGDATAQLQPPPFELAKETRNLAHLVAEFATREVNYRATLPPGSAR